MTDSTPQTKRFPIKAIAITAVISMALTWTGLHLLGFHASHGPESPARTETETPGKKQLWTCGMHPWIITEEPGLCPICNMELTPKRDDASADTASGSDERKILYWRAPMNPTEIYDKPGKSAMGMDLVPVYEDEVQGGVEIRIDPVIRQNMGIRTAVVTEAPLVNTIRTYGHITYDETRTAQVSLKVSGWVEKLLVNFTGDSVEAGQPLFEIYSPELVAAQEEYLTALASIRRGTNGRDLLDSARRRLEYFGIANTEIDTIRTSNKVSKTLIIRSPFTGIVTHKNAVEGAFVKAGTTIYRIADLSRVWVEAHIYEYELGQIRLGQVAEMILPYKPDTVYKGKVAFIYPYLQKQTRDVVVRMEFDNPNLSLKPDMYADVRIQTGQGKGLVIPSEAVIRSGERNLVFVAKGNGRFSPRETTLGMPVDGGKLQVLTGLAKGETIVTSGQFLLDSESKLKEAVQKMLEAKSGSPSQPPVSANNQEDDFFGDMESDNTAEDEFFQDMETPDK